MDNEEEEIKIPSTLTDEGGELPTIDDEPLLDDGEDVGLLGGDEDDEEDGFPSSDDVAGLDGSVY